MARQQARGRERLLGPINSEGQSDVRAWTHRESLFSIRHPEVHEDAENSYRDNRFQGTRKELEQALRTSTTLYVGNLSFYTTEDQIFELFTRAGDVRRVIMGLDRYRKTPCGFCFVVYYTRDEAENAVRFLNRTTLDGRIIRVDFDAGFKEGRQYGRGKHGGQVRDEYRETYDADRGGYGRDKQDRDEYLKNLDSGYDGLYTARDDDEYRESYDADRGGYGRDRQGRDESSDNGGTSYGGQYANRMKRSSRRSYDADDDDSEDGKNKREKF
nr:unnamed protein product [Haemonchus contortus]